MQSWEVEWCAKKDLLRSSDFIREAAGRVFEVPVTKAPLDGGALGALLVGTVS